MGQSGSFGDHAAHTKRLTEASFRFRQLILEKQTQRRLKEFTIRRRHQEGALPAELYTYANEIAHIDKTIALTQQRVSECDSIKGMVISAGMTGEMWRSIDETANVLKAIHTDMQRLNTPAIGRQYAEAAESIAVRGSLLRDALAALPPTANLDELDDDSAATSSDAQLATTANRRVLQNILGAAFDAGPASPPPPPPSAPDAHLDLLVAAIPSPPRDPPAHAPRPRHAVRPVDGVLSKQLAGPGAVADAAATVDDDDGGGGDADDPHAA